MNTSPLRNALEIAVVTLNSLQRKYKCATPVALFERHRVYAYYLGRGLTVSMFVPKILRGDYASGISSLETLSLVRDGDLSRFHLKVGVSCGCLTYTVELNGSVSESFMSQHEPSWR